MISSKSFVLGPNSLKLIAAFLLVTACSIPVKLSASTVQPETIRVALLKGVEIVKLDGNGLLVTDEDGKPLSAGLPVTVAVNRDGLSANGRNVREVVASAPDFVQINGKRYRGIIEISPLEKGMLVVDELYLEDYLVGLINCEISSQWPMEAIKAQAVVARSYALYQKESRKNAPYHLESSVLDQVYDGCDIEDSRAARGVSETAGEVLTYDGKVIQAFYHSSCGGHTEAVQNVWGYSLPYLQGVECKYCLGGAGKWTQTISLKKIESLLRSSGYQVQDLREIKTGKRDDSGRLTDLVLVTARGRFTISGVNFRKAIGYTVIKSTKFDVKPTGAGVSFSGSGYGHGVGLCQWGAKQRAEEGFSYREILSYYYPGTRLEKIYSDR
jgi:stage II sporulation protein D (peptidoglycan lytic transglycosylase)